jgi:DNA-binding NarL/FixJ family response regulator
MSLPVTGARHISNSTTVSATPINRLHRRSGSARLGCLVNILYLENHAVFAEQVVRQFLSAHRVTVVPSLSAGRSALASGSYDLILSDYDLDDGKGEEIVRECRAAHPRLPIIAASSHDAGNAALVSAGASAVCSKMEFDHIQEVITQLLRTGARHRQ